MAYHRNRRVVEDEGEAHALAVRLRKDLVQGEDRTDPPEPGDLTLESLDRDTVVGPRGFRALDNPVIAENDRPGQAPADAVKVRGCEEQSIQGLLDTVYGLAPVRT